MTIHLENLFNGEKFVGEWASDKLTTQGLCVSVFAHLETCFQPVLRT
jgi:hypothetical protein